MMDEAAWKVVWDIAMFEFPVAVWRVGLGVVSDWPIVAHALGKFAVEDMARKQLNRGYKCLK
jgi:hypothetical protein